MPIAPEYLITRSDWKINPHSADNLAEGWIGPDYSDLIVNSRGYKGSRTLHTIQRVRDWEVRGLKVGAALITAPIVTALLTPEVVAAFNHTHSDINGINILPQNDDEPESEILPPVEVAGVTTEGALPAEGEVESPTVVPEVVVPNIEKPINPTEVAGVTSSTENPQILVPAPEPAPQPPVVARQPFDRIRNPADRELVLAVQRADGIYSVQRMNEQNARDILPLYVRIHDRVSPALVDTDINLVQSVFRYGISPSAPVQIDTQSRQFTGISIKELTTNPSDTQILPRNPNEGGISGVEVFRSANWRALEKLKNQIVNDPILGEVLRDFWDPSIDPATVQTAGLAVFVNGVVIDAFNELDDRIIDMKQRQLFGSHADRPQPLNGNYIYIDGNTSRLTELFSRGVLPRVHGYSVNNDVLGILRDLGEASMIQKREPVGDERAKLERAIAAVRCLSGATYNLERAPDSFNSLTQYFPVYAEILRNPEYARRK